MIMRIKQLREAKGIRQIELAADMGVNQTTVSMWETESALPRTRQLPALARVLGVTISELFEDDTPSDPSPADDETQEGADLPDSGADIAEDFAFAPAPRGAGCVAGVLMESGQWSLGGPFASESNLASSPA